MKKALVVGAISPEKIATSIAHHQVKTNIGGHAIFLGQVRADEIDGKTVKAILSLKPTRMTIADIKYDVKTGFITIE